MSTTPLVNIVMPTYNHERFVAQAIESVLAQKTEFAYKLMVGDDCSTDGTQEVVRSYAEKYPDKVGFVFSKKNLGLSDRDRVSLKLLSQCTAKYVGILDGDDYWTDSYRLQKLTDFLESHPECSVAFHNAVMFYDDGSRAACRFYPPDLKEISSQEDMITTNGFPILCTALFRNEALGELPDCFFRVTNADWMLFVLLAEHGNLGYINEVMAAYRVHSGGIWSRIDPIQGTREQIKTYEAIDAYLNFKYTTAISEKIAAWRKKISLQQGQSCLTQYHTAVKNGEIQKGVGLLWRATLFAPLLVFRPLSFAAVLKNGLLGVLLQGRKGELNLPIL